jgi:predicted enzyme related to lactoylglutathione lyase
MNFNSILIGTDDPARLAAYYTKLFGAPSFAEGAYSSWMIGSGAVSIGPHDQVHGKNAQPGRLIWNLESPDVKADFERLKTAGATVVREPYEFEDMQGTWIATFSDPDDNYFQLMSPFELPSPTA